MMTTPFNISGQLTRNYWDSDIEGEQQPESLTPELSLRALSTVVHGDGLPISSTNRENSPTPPIPAYVGEKLTSDELNSAKPFQLSTDEVASETPPIPDNKSTLRTRAIPAPYRRPEEQSSQPRHDDYFTYTKYPTNLAYGIITFFIGGQIRKTPMFPGPGIFDVTTSSPSGRSCTMSIQIDPSRPRYTCSFTALEPGVYKGAVLLLYPDEPRHINGSPFQITVSRDYNISKPRFTAHALRHKRENISEESLPPVKCWGIDVDLCSGKIYMINKAADSVKILSTNGSKLRKLLEFGNQDNQEQLCRPCGIAVDAVNKRIVISDKNNHRICFWSLDGEFLHGFGKRGDKNGEFCYPWGVAVSPKGVFIAVADSKNRRIQIFDKFGNFLRKFSNTGAERKADLRSPRGICFDKTGENIYVTDHSGRAVYVFDLDLTHKRPFVPPRTILRPQGLTVDKAGNVLICDSKQNCVHVVTSDGTFLSKISGDDKFIPQDLAILRDGQVAVLDDEGTIRMY